MRKVFSSFPHRARPPFRFETSSTTMIFCLHLLAHHQEIQNEARESIKSILIKYNGEFCYEAVQEMTFVEQIIEGDISWCPVWRKPQFTDCTLLRFRNPPHVSSGKRHPSLGFQGLPAAERINSAQRNGSYYTSAGFLSRSVSFS